MDPYWFKLGAVALTGGIGAIFLGVYLRARAVAQVQRSWPTTFGNVLDCKLIPRSSRSTRTGVSSPRYRVKVRYSYQVDGRRFTGDRISSAMNKRVMGTVAAMELVDRFEKGKRVRVHYSPRDPAQSCLDPGLGDGSRLFAGVLFILLASGLGWLLFIGFDGGDERVRSRQPVEPTAREEANRAAASLSAEQNRKRADQNRLGTEQVRAASERAAAHVKKGNELLRERDYKRAIISFRKAVAEDPELASAHRALGMAYAKLNKKKKACLAYKEYLGLLPADSKDRPTLQKMVKAGGCW